MDGPDAGSGDDSPASAATSMTDLRGAPGAVIVEPSRIRADARAVALLGCAPHSETGVAAFIEATFGEAAGAVLDLRASCPEGGVVRGTLGRGSTVWNNEGIEVEIRRFARDELWLVWDPSTRGGLARFEALFAHHEAAHVLLDPERVLACNRAAITVLGAAHAKQLVGRRVADLSPRLQPSGRESAQQWASQWQLARQQGSRSFAWESQRLDGKRIPTRVTLTPVELGGSARMMAVLHDLTEERRAQATLAASEKRFRTMVEIQRDVWFRVDAKGVLLDHHVPTGVHAYQEPSELLGGRLVDVLPPRTRLLVTEAIERALSTGDQQSFDYELDLPSGRRWFNCRVTASSPAEAFINLSDISRGKQAELKLRQAKDDAEQATRAKSRFVAAISHEMRTPINGVLGMADLLLDTELTDEQRTFVNMLIRSGRALMAVINDVLDYSKIESRGLSLEQVEFSPREAVENAAGVVAEQAHSKGLRLLTLLDDDMPECVVGDPTRLRQVLVNLLSNAVKFTHRGEIVLRVGVAARTGDTLTTRFAVADTGIGISAEAKPTLFRPFSQADESTTRRFGGTGLGLAICQRLTQLMGGRIGVDSAPGEGSTFWFEVPLNEAEVDADAAIDEPASPRRRTTWQNATAAVVSTDAHTLRSISHDVARLGITTFEFADPGELLGVVDQLRPDVIVADLPLGDRDVETFAQELNQACSGRVPPQVAVTAFGVPVDAARARDAGFASVVTRPIRRRQLKETMQRVLSEGGGQAATSMVRPPQRSGPPEAGPPEAGRPRGR